MPTAKDLYNGTTSKTNKQMSMSINIQNSSPISSTCSCSVTTSNTKVTSSSGVKTKTTTKANSSISYGKVDKRVSLTVSPKTSSRDETLFVNKVKYVLGTKQQQPSWVLKGNYFYGLLRNALGSTSGLIFPYTPSIDFNHNVNYETTEITHSNISYNYYKNTPPPTLSLSAKFTADNRQNALHMLSAIWFVSACTKCDFGERSNGYGGTPPPVLYLNGYESLIDNIPVVITSASYKYPEDKHYVNLVLDMSKDNNTTDSFCKIYDSETVTSTVQTNSVLSSLSGMSDVKTTSHKKGIDMSFWLPTEISLTLGLKIQPNLLKTRKQWSLDDYKTGMLMTDRGKNPPVQPIKYTETVTGTMEVPQISILTGETCCKKVSYSYDTEHTSYTTFIPSGWTW